MTNQLKISPWRYGCRVQALNGSIVQAPLLNTFIGECCELRQGTANGKLLARAQTVGFNEQFATLSLLGAADGLPKDAMVVRTNYGIVVSPSSDWLGMVIDANGNICAPLSNDKQSVVKNKNQALFLLENKSDLAVRAIDTLPIDFLQRCPVSEPFITGIRAIDSLLTCGEGQRIGIFATAGGGKTSLITMLLTHAQADIVVIGLIGERGREASEFIAHGIPEHQKHRTVLVVATSDNAPADRRNAALLATTVAEYFRDLGAKVLLLMDSVTRYARALRDISLSAGESPARRGYPASVFEALPRLLERSGNTKNGSITAFYTVLIEDEEEGEPIGDEVRSILDGHLYLSRKLGGRGHYPAIDILRSVSRVMTQIVSLEHLTAANSLRAKLAKLADLKLIVELGEYQPGENKEVDKLLEQEKDINQYLQQDISSYSSFDSTTKYLYAFQ